MENIKILWIDDEIDLLKIHIILLEEHGYKVFTASNVQDGLNILKKNNIDIIFLDENMPGISGLEVLPDLKNNFPAVPVIMVTKREDEEVMDEAIGQNVDGYLIKPVKPQQILLMIKKNVLAKKIFTEKTTSKYQENFRELSNKIAFARDFEDWTDIYREIINWEMKLESTDNVQMAEIIREQKKQANKDFCKFVEKNYIDWIQNEDDRPPIIFQMMEKKVLPLLNNGEKVFLIVIDNFRYDQWLTLKAQISKLLTVKKEDVIMTILPSVTQYARNAFFAGYLPLKISQRYPDLWRDEEEEGNKNDFELQLLEEFLSRKHINLKVNFKKIFNDEFAFSKLKDVKSFLNYDLNVFIFNFVDIVAHAKTNMSIIKDIARDDKSYRNLVKLWFEDSYLHYLLNNIQKTGVKVVLTTDHGSILVENDIKIIGDRFSSTNIRYKQGKNLNYNPKEVFVINKPESAGLPKMNVSTKYIFAKSYDYMVYPKNYHQFAKYYKNTFQHGGISMEELLIPFIMLDA